MAKRKMTAAEAGTYGAAVRNIYRNGLNGASAKALEQMANRLLGIRSGKKVEGLSSRRPAQWACMSSELMDRRFDSLGRRTC